MMNDLSIGPLRMRSFLPLFLLLMLVSTVAGCSGDSEDGAAPCGAPVCKLMASDVAAQQFFGGSVSISGDVLVAGAQGDAEGGPTSGAVYVFRFDGEGWTEEQKLTAFDASEEDRFGVSVQVSGDIIVVGANGDDDDGESSGSAYVFRHIGTEWIFEKKLIASDGAEGDVFGTAVAVSGDAILVGAQGDDDDGMNSGAAYVYRFVVMDWVEEDKLTSSDAAGSDFFGISVAIEGDAIVAGASGDDDAGTRSGSAYVFFYDGMDWEEDDKLVASDAAERDFFGTSVAISDDVVVIGAAGDDDSFVLTGSAYVFAFDGDEWDEEGKLTASDAAEKDRFGSSVAVEGDVVVVGAPQIGEVGGGGVTKGGAAYVFGFDGMDWLEEEKLIADDIEDGDDFGFSVSISNSLVVVGAQSESNGADDSAGAAYVFD